MNHYQAEVRGFTLIELLVVIAIIGILSAVVLASLNVGRARARDAKRASDVHQFETALELYYSNNGHYPCGSTCGSSGVTAFNETSAPGAALVADKVISSIASDPYYSSGVCNNTGGGYCYCSLGTNSYVLTVNTEDDKGGSDRCYIRVGPSAATYCTGHQTPGSWATEDCVDRF